MGAAESRPTGPIGSNDPFAIVSWWTTCLRPRYIDEHLVRALIADQRPDLGDLPVTLLASGWDNVMFRLGEGFTARLPRREIAVRLVQHEQRWLPEIADGLPLPVPVPVHSGRPACGYPWPWSICPWMPGSIADETEFDAEAVAVQLGKFLGVLHRPAPSDAPVNLFRGVPLADRNDITRERAHTLAPFIDASTCLSLWDELMATPTWSGPPLWLHGDLHPANILVSGRRVTGVIDFGDITGGDPATDLAVAWMLFEPSVRSIFRAAASTGADGARRHVDDDTWRRAKGWALALALAYLAGSADHPLIAGIGRRTLAAVLADPD
jgi:aminoglycoside phosphotransferase (APT) family kinase protein